MTFRRVVASNGPEDQDGENSDADEHVESVQAGQRIVEAIEPRCMAALGLKMLELSAERSLGTLTYFVSVEHTRFARESIGETALIATVRACVVDADADRARAKARGYASRYLGLSNYTNNLRKFGFTDEDIGDGGSDRLIDAVIPHGTGEEIAAVAHQHLNAGANHVCLQPIGVNGVPREEWTALSAALVR